MKCYTFLEGRGVTPGIRITQDPHLGWVVRLGEEGRGRRLVKVPLHRQRPPEVAEVSYQHRIIEADPVQIKISRHPYGEKKFWVLAATSGGQGAETLVKVNTQGPYTRDTWGKWEPLEGAPKTITQGHGARGDAGRVGGWTDSLVVIRPGDAILVRPEGGYKTRPQVVANRDSEIVSMPLEDYEILQAQS